MTKLEALKALAEKVEAGEARPYEVEEDALDVWPNGEGGVRGWLVASSASKAYGGSIDAAKALHEAVLPEWCYWQVLMRTSWVDVVLRGPRTGHRGYQNLAATVRRDDDITCPARAWLLAIIRGLIAQEESP